MRIFPILTPILALSAFAATSPKADGLVFDINAGTPGNITPSTGKTVNYMAYEWLFRDTDSRQGFSEEQKTLSAAQKVKDAGADISADLGFTFNQESIGRFTEPMNGGMPPQGFNRAAGGPGGPSGNMPMMRMGGGRDSGDYALDESFAWIESLL